MPALQPVFEEPKLRRRMQGKSCFNFTKIDEGLSDELSVITAKGREMYAARGWLASPPTWETCR